MLSWLSKPKNREVLTWIGSGAVALAAGAWTVVTYLWPHHEDTGKSVVCAQGGSIAAGRDSSGNMVINSGGSGPPANPAPCVDGKK